MTDPAARLERAIARYGHGHRNTYAAGCGCPDCTEANRLTAINEELDADDEIEAGLNDLADQITAHVDIDAGLRQILESGDDA